MKRSMKPNWIDQVKEITVEEARLLDNLGVQVYGDYYISEDNPFFSTPDWDKDPHWLRVLFYKAEEGFPVVFYLPKEGTDE